MEKKRIYLSGKVRGLDDVLVRRTFGRAEQDLTIQGFDVVNPLRIVETCGIKDESMLLLHLLKELSKCDAIWMLEGWRQGSHGAACEYHFARSSGIEVLNDRPPLLDEILGNMYRPFGQTEEMLVKSSAEIWMEIDEMVPDGTPQGVADWLRRNGFQTKVIDGTVNWLLFDKTV